MGAQHDNTVSGKRGSHTLSKIGIVSYFPIQDGGLKDGAMKPYLGLLLFQRYDGEIFCQIDERWPKLEGTDE
jgi:hypothetical protein